MPKVFITTRPNGDDSQLCVIRINGDDSDGKKLAKSMFELSRTGDDMSVHFDPDVHTLSAITAGLPGHHSLTSREYDESELPSDRIFRDAWEEV
jgi:hypothetical protein